MKRSEKLALFLGILSGDGCLSKKHNGQGGRMYPIQFYNLDRNIMKLFEDLFYDLFEIKGRVISRKREGRRGIWKFLKHSKKVVSYLKELGFP